MARLYFHLFDSVGFVPDEEGKEVPDAEAARNTAVAAIRSIVAEEVRHGRVDLRGRIEITSSTNQVLAVVHFTDAVELLSHSSK